MRSLPMLVLSLAALAGCAGSSTVRPPPRPAMRDGCPVPFEAPPDPSVGEMRPLPWTGEYPLRQEHLSERERQARERLLEERNPGWVVRVGPTGAVYSAETSVMDCAIFRSLETQGSPRWESPDEIPSAFREQVARFVARSWDALGLDEAPPPGTIPLRVGIGFQYFRSGDRLPLVRYSFSSCTPPPEPAVATLPAEQLLEHWLGGSIRAYREECIPCQEGPDGTDTCGCDQTDLASVPIDAETASVDLRPRVYEISGGLELRLVATLDYSAALSRFEPYAEEGFGLSVDGAERVFDAVTGEEIPARHARGGSPCEPADAGLFP